MADQWAREFNGDDDEDGAMERAIAMSLGKEPETEPRTKEPVVVDLTEDDIETASESSSPGLQVAEKAKPATQKKQTSAENGRPIMEKQESLQSKKKPSAEASEAEAARGSGLSLLGLNRAKMEQERLARLQKRKASQEEQDGGQSHTKRMRTNDENRPLVAASTSQKDLQEQISQPHKDTKASASRFTSSPGTTNLSQQPSNLSFPKGVVKKTWARGQPRLGDDIQLEEVLRKDELEMALISSFQWDQEWMLDKFDLRKTRLILVSTGGDEAENEALRASVPSSRIQFCFPPMHGPGNMHSKLQILKFATYLRIAVPTGNFVPYDWGETGVMENMVFVIDLPKISDAGKQAVNKLTPFGEDVAYFLEAQGVDEGLVRSLAKYDFSETAGYGFVHSIAGSHADDSWRRTGYCGLGRTVAGLGLSSPATIDVDVVTSSLGAVTYDFLQMIYNACQGDDGLREYETRTAPKSKKTADAAAVMRRLDVLRSHVRVYFPSEKTIEQSLGGEANAGTIYFHSRWWNQTTFPKAVLRDCRSTRAGMLMHSKVLYVRRHVAPDSTAPSRTAGFAYVGSANVSESAWGRLVKDKASGKPKLTCRNWECGVVVPVRHVPGHNNDRQAQDDHMLGVFDGRVPVPMQTPGAPYIDANAGNAGFGGLGGVVLKPWCLG